jgi:hypothetical protein
MWKQRAIQRNTELGRAHQNIDTTSQRRTQRISHVKRRLGVLVNEELLFGAFCVTHTSDVRGKSIVGRPNNSDNRGCFLSRSQTVIHNISLDPRHHWWPNRNQWRYHPALPPLPDQAKTSFGPPPPPPFI